MSGVYAQFLRRLRQAGAVLLADPRAMVEWRRLLEQRERRREQREFDELARRLDPDNRQDWW